MIVDSRSFGAIYGGYAGSTIGSKITTKGPSAVWIYPRIHLTVNLASYNIN